MKKYILSLVSVAALLSSCEVEDKYYGKEVVPPSEKLEPAYALDWTANADKTTAVLIDEFMNKSKGTFWGNDQNRIPGNTTYCYWPQAHAMDVVVDAYNRLSADDVRKAEYADYMSLWHQNRGNNYSSPGFKNDFTDDMEWIVLTLIRMYEATGEAKYLTSAQETYDNYIRTRFADDVAKANGVIDPNGGGFRWYYTSGRPLENPDNGKPYSVNACSNGPGILCAMRLWANVTDEADKEKYLADAKRAYNWLVSTLYNPLTGAVADNMCQGVIGGGPLSYNQGTFLGSAYELYKATGDKKYMAECARAARYNMVSMVSEGVLKGEGTGDNSLFKGIFVRYAMNVWKDTTVDAADPALRAEIKDFLIYNGLICWTKGVDRTEGSKWFFGPFWGDIGSSWDGQLNPQVSASTMIEAMALLIKK